MTSGQPEFGPYEQIPCGGFERRKSVLVKIICEVHYVFSDGTYHMFITNPIHSASVCVLYIVEQILNLTQASGTAFYERISSL